MVAETSRSREILMAESTVATRSQPQAPAPVPQRAAAGMFPSTKKVAVVAGGRHTDIVVSEFSDRFLVVLTQFGKIGTVVRQWSVVHGAH